MSNFLPFFKKKARDERKDHGAVNQSSLEQQIRESANYTLIVRKTGVLGLVLPGLTAGRPAVRQAVRRNHLSTRKF